MGLVRSSCPPISLATSWPAGEHIDYQIEIDVQQFDNDASGNTRLIAHWKIKDVHQRAYLVDKETTVAHSQSPGKDGARVAALSDALRDLGQDVASALG